MQTSSPDSPPNTLSWDPAYYSHVKSSTEPEKEYAPYWITADAMALALGQVIVPKLGAGHDRLTAAEKQKRAKKRKQAKKARQRNRRRK